MKQVLIYLVEFLKEQHGMSMAEMSKGLGKGRNFIREAITRGYENEDNYVDIMNNLKFNFFHSNDDNEFYMFMAKKHQESIRSYKDALKQSVESNLDEIEKKNKQISELEHRIVVLSREVDKVWNRTESQNEAIVKLNNSITTKDKFIDGQDEEIKGLNERLSVLIGKAELEKELISNLKLELEGARGLIKTGNNKVGRQDFHIKNLEEMHEDLKSDNKFLYTENTKLQKRNRILISMLLLFCAIDLIMAFLRYM